MLGVIAGFVILALLAAVGYLWSLSRAYDGNVQTFAATEDGRDPVFPPEEERPAPVEDGSMNILLLGSDEGGGSGENEDLPRVPGGGRSDTMMLVHLPADRDSVQVISIPRDLWVEIPGGYGWHKINAGLALAPEGPWLTTATVESLFDVRVDHVAAIDLEGFTSLVDAMGGVTVNNTYPTEFTQYGYTFNQGEIHMDSGMAEAFVRHRKSFPEGDLQRIRNQQAFIRAVIRQAASGSNLANPVRVHDMVSTFAPHLIVDEELDSSTAAGLLWEFRGAVDNIQFATLPNGGSSWSDDGQWIFVQDQAAMEEIRQALRDGTLEEYLSR
ncbi:LCP family protein [Nesterenkonia flava]